VNDRQRLQLAKAVAGRLLHAYVALDRVDEDGTTVIGRMRDARVGIRARNYEATTHTLRHDATFTSATRDRAEEDERDLDRLLETVARKANELLRILGNYPPPHVATAEERRHLGLGDGPTCTSCARTPGPDGEPRREPIRADLAGPTDVAGRLDVPAYLCAWCYGCVRDWGRPPTPDEVERHHSVGRVPWPSDVTRPA
jgi:hypothetical protein